jgi:hypothetical protein
MPTDATFIHSKMTLTFGPECAKILMVLIIRHPIFDAVLSSFIYSYRKVVQWQDEPGAEIHQYQLDAVFVGG